MGNFDNRSTQGSQNPNQPKQPIQGKPLTGKPDSHRTDARPNINTQPGKPFERNAANNAARTGSGSAGLTGKPTTTQQPWQQKGGRDDRTSH